MSGPPQASAPVAPLAASGGVTGIVRQVSGPVTEEKAPDPWQQATRLIIALGLLPLWLAWQFLRIGMHFMFAAFLGGKDGKGLLPDSSAVRQRGPDRDARAQSISVYHYVVATPSGHLVSIRQEGEFIDGRILQGHRVHLRGRWRDGTLVITSGENETLSCRLSYPPNLWKAGFFLALLGVIAELLLLVSMSMGQSYRGVR